MMNSEKPQQQTARSPEKTMVLAPNSLAWEAMPRIPDHELLRRIGEGAYGEVWLARNVMGTFRAVKVVYRSTFTDDRPYEREFSGIKKFEPISRSHANQVDILHVGRNEQAGYFYYVMELADDASADSLSHPMGEGRGEGQAFPVSTLAVHPETYIPKTLRSELQRRGRLPFDECLDLALALATALEHLHHN